MRYIFLIACFFVVKVNAQNVVSVSLQDVVCQLKSYKSFKHISDSIEKRINSLNDSVINSTQNRCIYSRSIIIEPDKWNSNYMRWIKESIDLDVKYTLLLDSMNNEIRKELKSISEQYCLLNKIDLFFTSNDPPLFGIMPKDVSEEFAAYILSLE